MANENQNTGANPQDSQQTSKKSIIDAKAALRELIEDQGDYNNLLKSSLRDLDNMQKSYTRISAKIDSLNKGAINVKQVQQELARLNQKEYIAKQKVLDLEEGLSQETKQQQKNAETLNSLYKKAVTEKERERVERQIAINDAKLAGNIELQNLEYAKIAAKISQEELNAGKAALENEKQVSKQMGISGNLMQKFAEKLGVGEEAYAAMSFEARKLVDQNGKIGGFGSKLKVLQSGLKAGAGAIKESFTDPVAMAGMAVGAYKLVSGGLDMVGGAAAKAGNFIAGMSEDSGNVVRGLASSVSDLVRNIPLVGGLLGGLIDGFAAILDLILGVDNMIVKTGRQLNMSADAARGLYRGLAQASQASGDVYMNGKKYLESQLELTKELGIANTLSTELLRTNVQLKDFAGLEADTRARIVESSKITGKSAEATTKAVLSQVVGLQRATGVSFQYQKILKEVSNLGGYLGLQFAKYPKELTKSYLVAKTLGLELKQLDAKASGFLDFESSISKEFEAQLLTGKEINLAKAREAFLNNDLATAASEITRQVGSTADFMKMNRIQQDAFAGAMEMSRDELADMLKQQELYSKFGVKNREELLKQVDLLKQQGRVQEAINKAGGEAAYNDLVRASAQEKLMLFIEKIKQTVVEFIERSGFIEKVEKFINYLTNPGTIKGIIGTIKNAISSFITVIGEVLADVIEVGGEIANFFTFGAKGDARERSAYELGAKIRAGSLEMSANVRGDQGQYSGVSVGGNAANSQVKGSGGGGGAASQNDMAMAGSAGGNIPVNVTTYVVDTPKKAEVRYGRAAEGDKQTGQ